MAIDRPTRDGVAVTIDRRHIHCPGGAGTGGSVAANRGGRDDVQMEKAVEDYIESIAAAFRPLFDRLHALIAEAHPDVAIALSYGMPVFMVGDRRLFVGVWKKWISIYGWDQGRDAFRGPASGTTDEQRHDPVDSCCRSEYQ